MVQVVINPVVIRYLLVDSKNWNEIRLDYSSYFEVNSKYHTVFDLIEKQFLEPRFNVIKEIEKVLFLSIIASDNLGNKKITNSTYWNQGLCEIQEYSEYVNESLRYKTTMLAISEIEDSELKTILRFENLNSKYVPIMHVKIKNDYSSMLTVNLDDFIGIPC